MPTLVTYPPLDVPKPVADGVWIVDSGPIRALGLPLPIRMTVIRLEHGELLLHSPTRYSLPLRDALAACGPIAHVVLPNVAHWTFAREWQNAVPGVTIWAAPGLRQRGAVRRSGLVVDHDLGPMAPAAWAGEIDHIVVPGAAGFQEIALHHRATRTLVLTDLVQGLEPPKLPGVARTVLRALGAAGPEARPPIYLRAVVRLGGHAAREAGARLVALEPERVIFAHGQWFEQNAAERLRRSLAWLVG